MTGTLEGIVGKGDRDTEALSLGDGIFMSRGIANCYLITTSAGNVLINTGLPAEVERTRARFAAVSSTPLKAIIFTQGHPDHVGGWSAFHEDGIDTIAQANHGNVREYWSRLNPYYAKRITKLWGRFTGRSEVPRLPPEPVLTATFVDSHCFELGGRRFELLATPGGETTDSLVVWLPKCRTVFIGNLMGPMFGHLPNLYTIRGDKLRSALAFVQSVERVIDLNPEVLLNGHEAFSGAERIRETLTRVRDAIVHVRDEVFAGMNRGDNLWTLMRTVRLPDSLDLPGLHGKLSWIVRAIWEEHTGWFRYECSHPAKAAGYQVWCDMSSLEGADGCPSLRSTLT